MSRIDQLLTPPRLSTLREALDRDARRLLRAAEAAAREQDAPLWLVGGAVRDLALGRPVHDLDVAINGDVARFARACGAAVRGIELELRLRTRFGTASLRSGAIRLDAARLRTESYAAPGALPRVRATRSIERDLARRDFTANAMALTLTGPDRGTFVDPFDGLDDLARHRLRVLHPRSFEDDATRIWRGARTAVVAGLRPDSETARLIEDGVRWLGTISGDRLRAELVFTARRGRTASVLTLLDAWGALRSSHPAFHFHEVARHALRHRPQPLPPTRLAAVLLAPLNDAQGVLDRLNVDRETRETVIEARRLLEAAARSADPDLLDGLEGTREEARIAARWLDPQGQARLQRELARWERTRPHLDAVELQDLGIAPGPELGRMLDRLRRARFLGTLTSEAAARRALRNGTLDGERLDAARRGDS